jgi:hypothetical protein
MGYQKQSIRYTQVTLTINNYCYNHYSSYYSSVKHKDIPSVDSFIISCCSSLGDFRGLLQVN